MQVSVANPATGQPEHIQLRGQEGGTYILGGADGTVATAPGTIKVEPIKVEPIATTEDQQQQGVVVSPQPVPITIRSIDPNIQHHQVYSIQPIQVQQQPQQTVVAAAQAQSPPGAPKTVTMATSPPPGSSSPPKKMGKKGNKKNVWVPGKPLTPKAREMMESGKGSMNQDGRWTCVECNRSLSNEWTLEQHIQTVHGERIFNCKSCNKKFKRRDHLLNHIKTIHKGLKPCKKCNVVFINKEELRAHKMAVHLKLAPEDTAPPPLAKNTAQDVHQYLEEPSPPNTPANRAATAVQQVTTSAVPIQQLAVQQPQVQQRSANVIATYDNLVDGFSIPQRGGTQQVVVTINPQQLQQGQQITYQQQPISVVPVAVSQVPAGATISQVQQQPQTAYITAPHQTVTAAGAQGATTLQTAQPVAVEMAPSLSASPVKPTITYRYIVN